MKKALFFLLLALSLNSFAQIENNPLQSDTTNVKYTYCEIVGTEKLMSTKVTIQIDFGNETSLWKDNRMKDETGKPRVFNSMIDALNFMGSDGWEFVQAYVVGGQSGVFVYHFLLKKVV